MQKFMSYAISALVVLSAVTVRAFVFDPAPYSFSGDDVFVAIPAESNLVRGVEATVVNGKPGQEGSTGVPGNLTDGAVPVSKLVGYTVGNGTELTWAFPSGFQSVTELRFYTIFDWAGHNAICFSKVEWLDGAGDWHEIPGLAYNYYEKMNNRRLFVTGDDGAALAENARAIRVTFNGDDTFTDSFYNYAEIEVRGEKTWKEVGSALVSGPVDYSKPGETEVYSFSADGCTFCPQVPMNITKTSGGETTDLGLVPAGQTIDVSVPEGGLVVLTCGTSSEVTAPSPVISGVSGSARVTDDTAVADLAYSILWSGSPSSVCALKLLYGASASALDHEVDLASGLRTGDTGVYSIEGLVPDAVYYAQLVAVNDDQLEGRSAVTAFRAVRLPTSTWNYTGSNWANVTCWEEGVVPDAPGVIADFSKYFNSSFTYTLKKPYTLGTLLLGSHTGAGENYSRFNSSETGAFVFDRCGAPGRVIIHNGGTLPVYTEMLNLPVTFEDGLIVDVHRQNTLELQTGPFAGGSLTLPGSNVGTVRFNVKPTLTGNIAIGSGMLSANVTTAGTYDFFGEGVDVTFGAAGARRVARLEYAKVSGGTENNLGTVTVASDTEADLVQSGGSGSPAKIAVEELALASGSALNLCTDGNKAQFGVSETFELPAGLPVWGENGLLSPAITATPKGDACPYFLAQDATSGELSVAAEASSFGGGNQLVSFGSMLQADCAALGVRPGGDFNLNGFTLTLGDGQEAGLLFSNGRKIRNGKIDWLGGDLFANVYSPNYTLRPDSGATHAGSIENALADASGTLTKTGCGRLTLVEDALPSGISYRVLNGFLRHSSGVDTVFDSSAYTILNKGIWEFAGDRGLTFAGEGLEADGLGFADKVRASFGAGQTLKVNHLLQVNDATLTFTGGARFENGQSPVYVGENCADSSLVATGEGTLLDLAGQSLVVSRNDGGASRADRNALSVGEGAVVTNVFMLNIGECQGGRDGNSITIASGAKVYSRASRIGSMCQGSVFTVTGAGTLWDNGGGDIEVGESGGGTAPHDNELHVTDGAILTNVNAISVSRASAGGNCTNNHFIVDGGAKVFSAGESTVGWSCTGNSWTSNSWALVEGEGSSWNLGAGTLIVGYALQGYSACSTMTVRNGGTVSAGGVQMGRSHARTAIGDRLAITNGASFASTGEVLIGCSSTDNQNTESRDIEAYVADSSVWDMNGGTLRIGRRNGKRVWVHDCRLRVGPGGEVRNVGEVHLGDTYDAGRVESVTDEEGNTVETTDKNTCDCVLALEGGVFTGSTLTVYPGNGLAATIASDDFAPAVFSGKATFQENTFVKVNAAKGAPSGRYRVLEASSLSGLENVRFVTDTPQNVRFLTDETGVYAKVTNNGFLMIIR